MEICTAKLGNFSWAPVPWYNLTDMSDDVPFKYNGLGHLIPKYNYYFPNRRRASSVDSQLSEFVQQFVQHSARRGRRRLGRSKSDSKIAYTVNEASEAPGTVQYITPEGELNVKVVFKALHLICSREPIVRSVRICVVALSLIDLLFHELEKDEEVLIVLDTITKFVHSLKTK